MEHVDTDVPWSPYEIHHLRSITMMRMDVALKWFKSVGYKVVVDLCSSSRRGVWCQKLLKVRAYCWPTFTLVSTTIFYPSVLLHFPWFFERLLRNSLRWHGSSPCIVWENAFSIMDCAANWVWMIFCEMDGNALYHPCFLMRFWNCAWLHHSSITRSAYPKLS